MRPDLPPPANLYEAPRAGVGQSAEGLDPSLSDAEWVRRTHLRHESNVKTVGQFCYLVAFFWALATLEFFLLADGVIPHPPEFQDIADPSVIAVVLWGMSFAFLFVTLVHLALGFGLIRLQSWARWTVVALVAINLVVGNVMCLVLIPTNPIEGLVGLAINSAINGLILYPLLTPQSGVVFSRSYKQVIRETPQIKSRMNLALKILIGLLGAGLVLGVILVVLMIFGYID